MPKEGDPDPLQTEEAKLNPIPYAIQNILSIAVKLDPTSSSTTKVPFLQQTIPP